MKTLLILTVLTLLLLAARLCQSQTVPSPAPAIPYPAPVQVVTAVPTPQQSAWATLVAEDVRKLVFDVLSGFSWSGLGSAVLIVYLGSKGLRNYAPIDPAGRVSAILNLLNLERRVAPAEPPRTVPSNPTSPQ